MLKQLLKSWRMQDSPLNPNREILEWVRERNESLVVNIRPNRLSESGFWYYDEEGGCVTNQNHSFFTIRGMRAYQGDLPALEQPVIVQDEIGYLGILCKEFDGVLYFLMQAKIEPGNVNKIQLSPTIQATKSNFTQKHGGKKPPYLDYFLHADQHTVLVDQIQSEQSSRFYKKRNRNLILLVREEVEVLPSHRWMTLGQLKELMKVDNLVNMDTRTVLSCIPFSLLDGSGGKFRRYFRDQALHNSIFDDPDPALLPAIYGYINNFKMFRHEAPRLLPLSELKDWELSDSGICCRHPYSFDVIYCDIEVEGREVRRWTQPLFRAKGMACFGLFTTVRGGKRLFLVHAVPEPGCFDGIELGPTVQREAVCAHAPDEVEAFFLRQYEKREGVLYHVILSEEGGRFYQEQNRNVILEIPPKLLSEPPEGYFWADFRTLNLLTQVNNCLNIQLRNLLSLLEV